MAAYTGATIEFPFLGRVIFDLAGMRLSLPAPALREHVRDRAVGVLDASFKTLACLTAEGYFVSTPDGREIRELILEGFPYQASIGIWPETLEEVKAGESARVNGGIFEGAGFIVRQSHVREVSFVSLGADPGTSVAALAAGKAQRRSECMEPANFSEAVLFLLREGHRIEVATHLAATKFPELYRAYHSKISGIPAPDPQRPDILLAEAARELAASAGIGLEAATSRVLIEQLDLAKKYWEHFHYKP